MFPFPRQASETASPSQSSSGSPSQFLTPSQTQSYVPKIPYKPFASDLGTGAIAGIAIAVLLFIGIVAILVLWGKKPGKTPEDDYAVGAPAPASSGSSHAVELAANAPAKSAPPVPPSRLSPGAPGGGTALADDPARKGAAAAMLATRPGQLSPTQIPSPGSRPARVDYPVSSRRPAEPVEPQRPQEIPPGPEPRPLAGSASSQGLVRRKPAEPQQSLRLTASAGAGLGARAVTRELPAVPISAAPAPQQQQQQRIGVIQSRIHRSPGPGGATAALQSAALPARPAPPVARHEALDVRPAAAPHPSALPGVSYGRPAQQPPSGAPSRRRPQYVQPGRGGDAWL